MIKKIIRGLLKTVLVLLTVIIVMVAGYIGYFMLFTSNADYSDNMRIVDQTELVIVDCDNSMGSFWEVDDGMVIAYLMNKPEANLLGITTTFGNKTYDHKYTVMMLEKLDRADTPLYKGEQQADSETTEAAKFLAEKAAANPGQITIIAAGPLGNLKAAYDLDHDFFKNVKEIVIMGGYTEPLILGSREVSELNLSADYQASYEVLYSEAKITLMTAQACLDAPFYFKDLKNLKNFPLSWKFQNLFWLTLQKLGLGNNYYVLWDLLPASYAFNNEYFDNQEVYLNSSLDDLKTGTIIYNTSGEGKLINMPKGIRETEKFYDDLFLNWNR
ncbi:MAG: nucleoside hydrolase [Clostridia bacterium]|nr:nucleoside hydrolase [Clostridia bacterium]